MKQEYVVYGLSASRNLAEHVAKFLKRDLGAVKVSTFADGELFIQNETSVRGKIVFVIQSTSNPVNTSLMELLIFVDSLRRSSAKEINVIIPYFGYSRQDRKTHGRHPITTSLVARLLEEAGVDRMITFDLHASQILGFFKIPVDELKAFGLLGTYLKSLKIKDLVIVSPDHGGLIRTRQLSKYLNAPIAIIDKRRIGINEVEAISMLGEVKGKNCILYDDIVDTGGTIMEAYKILKKNGAKDVYVAATHGILSQKNGEKETVEQKFKDLGIKELIVTNSIEIKESKFLKVVDLAKPIAGVIETHVKNESITDYFIKKYNAFFY
ncbi:MAG: ribose-phosphate pyrophosphokinase [Candidatus Hepatoplasma vulgare]|nr:MAG: ribose-phosphate pyrophosphokinase [Candidatus Hepatoplasma sp.]